MSNKTTLQAALQAAYEAAFGETHLPLATGGKNFATRPDELTDLQIAAIFRYGKRALNDSYNTDAKNARDSGDPIPDPEEFFADWLETLGTTKPRGGGSKLTPEVKGWIAYCNSKACKVKFKGVQANGKNLDDFLLALTKKAIWPSIRAHLKTLDESAQREFHATKLPGLLEQNKVKAMQAHEADMTKGSGVGWFIQQEIAKQSGKTPQDDITIDIEINL